MAAEASPSFELEGALARRGGRRLYESLVLTTPGGAVQRIRHGTVVLVNGSEEGPQVSVYVAYVREVMEGKAGGEPELAVYWLYRPNESPRKPHSTVTWGSTASPRELFFSSHGDTIPAESLVHCAVVHFLPSPPAADPTGAGFFVARVYDPASCNVHTLDSGNFKEPFASELNFIFEGPGKMRAAAAGAPLPSDAAAPPKAAKAAAPPSKPPAPKATPPPAAAPKPAAAKAPAAAPDVLQQPRGAPPPGAATVAATLLEVLRREGTHQGRVRVLNQVAAAAPQVLASLAASDAAASICAWMSTALRQAPPSGKEPANALLGAALKALQALPLGREALSGPRGESLVEAARMVAGAAIAAPAVRSAAAALASRWGALGAAEEQEESESLAATAAARDFGASPRSAEAAATLAGVARRQSAAGAKTPLAASNGGDGRTPAAKRAAPAPAPAEAPAAGGAAAEAPPPAKRAKVGAATADVRSEAAAVLSVVGAVAAANRNVGADHKRKATRAVEMAINSVVLALELSRQAREALSAEDVPTADADALIQGLETLQHAWTAPTR